MTNNPAERFDQILSTEILTRELNVFLSSVEKEFGFCRLHAVLFTGYLLHSLGQDMTEQEEIHKYMLAAANAYIKHSIEEAS